ncbi:MAG: hypothetical protein ABIS14_07925, partial [Sphingomonas sp.]
MALYYFDLYNGTGLTPDEEGREFQSPEEARKEAVDGIRSILGAEIANGSLDLNGRVEILDEARELVFTIR